MKHGKVYFNKDKLAIGEKYMAKSERGRQARNLGNQPNIMTRQRKKVCNMTKKSHSLMYENDIKGIK